MKIGGSIASSLAENWNFVGRHFVCCFILQYYSWSEE